LRSPLYIGWRDLDTGSDSLSSSLRVSESVNVTIWVRSNVTTTGTTENANITAGIYLQLGGSPPLLLNSLTKRQQPINLTETKVQILIPVNFPFFEDSNVVLGLNATSAPGILVEFLFGSPTTDSVAGLPVIAYAAVGPITIEDVNGTIRRTFYVNWTEGNNFVKILAPVRDAFGLPDISYVNFTIIGPDFQPVQSYQNVGVRPEIDNEGNLVSVFFFRFDRSSLLGNYRVYVDLVDVEGNKVQGPRGDLYTFGLDKTPLFVFPQPQDILPYAAGAGGVALAGFVYLQRRKKREYLAPFQHFYTLSGGPFASGSMVMIEGNTGSGKSLFAQQLMYDDLRSGKPCVFVSTADFPSKIRGGMKSLGFETDPYEGREYLRFVDCYSAEAGQPSQEKFYISSLSDLTSLGVKITSAISTPGEFPSVFFDSLTPLTPKSKPENIVSFAQAVGAKVRGVGGKAYFTVGSGTEPSILRNLEESSDCVIQMEAFEEKGIRRRRMRITKFRNRRFHEGWVTFTVEEGKGIIFYSKKPKR